MECFTFLRMGGSHDRIEIDLIANPDQDRRAARRELKAKLASFDAEKAECFLEKDRQRLLAVVEAGFGNFAGFNTVVRNVFETRASFRRPSSNRGWSVRSSAAAAVATAAVLPQPGEVQVVSGRRLCLPS